MTPKLAKNLPRYTTFVLTLWCTFIAPNTYTQSVLLTYATFENALKGLEGYDVLMIDEKSASLEAMLSDVGGKQIMLSVKNLEHCEAYRTQGKKIFLYEREIFLVETSSFCILSAPLPEYLACLQLTTTWPESGAQLETLLLALPFFTISEGNSQWPEELDQGCRIPGRLVWCRSLPDVPDGFRKKLLVEVEPLKETFEWLASDRCGCDNRMEFDDCGSFVLVWPQGRIGEIHLKARLGERLQFTYYFR